jgi:threonylcarbamoyladenosine tRNA methylthiotransferase MtaB
MNYFYETISERINRDIFIPRTVAAATLGCKVNFTETEGVLELFRRDGYTVSDGNAAADVYIINTCAVTGESCKKSRQMISGARKRNPNAVVAVIGCYSQTASDEIRNAGIADIVIGTENRGQILQLVNSRLNTPQTADALGTNSPVYSVSELQNAPIYDELPLESTSSRTRAFIKIQDGCENYCAYCIIPYARGGVRSRKPNDIINEVKRVVSGGCKEIVLTGIHIASYGKNSDDSLIDIITSVCAIDGVRRVRLGSLDPLYVTESFVSRLGVLPNICPHFHLPLQSGCDATLRRMNRKYTAAQYTAALSLLRGTYPDVSVTSDIIAGFPGETEQDFNRSFSYIESQRLSRLHVFPFSPRKNTAAAAMPNQVSASVKNDRKRKLLDLGERLETLYRERFHDAELDVLIEEKIGADKYRGLSGNYLNVCVVSENDITNEIVSVKISENGCFFL